MKRIRLSLANLICSGLLTGIPESRATNSISNALTGFAGNSTQTATQTALAAAGLEVVDAAPPVDPLERNGTIMFGGGGPEFGYHFAGDGGKNFIRTIANYGTVSFEAFVTIVASGDTINQYGLAYFGIGTGSLGAWSVPDWVTPFSSVHVEAVSTKLVTLRTQSEDLFDFAETSPFAPLGGRTHRLRMVFDSETKRVTFAIDFDYTAGPFVADVSPPPVDATPLHGADGWPVESSRIFFGGGNLTRFKDLSVTVRPSPLPALRITREPPQRVRLSWPTTATGFRLMRNNSFPTGEWQHVNINPFIIGTEYSVTVVTSLPKVFFRLERP